jgi:hypothetical protein
VGAPLYFGSNRQMVGIGAMSKNAITSIGRVNYGMGPRGFFQTDGFNYDYIDQPSIHDFVYDDFVSSLRPLVCSWADPSENYVFWSLPWGDGATDNTITVGFNIKNRTWTILAFARTAATSSAVLDFPVTFDRYGNIYQQGISGIATGSEFSPLQLDPTYTLQLPFGHAGFGDGGFGGWWSGDG